MFFLKNYKSLQLKEVGEFEALYYKPRLNMIRSINDYLTKVPPMI